MMAATKVFWSTYLALGGALICHADVLIDDDFSSSAIVVNSRFWSDQVDDGWNKFSTSDWSLSNGLLTNPGTEAGIPSEGAIGQFVSTAGIDERNTKLRISFDYDVGTGSTLYFHLIGWTTNGTPSSSEMMGNTGAQNGSIQNQGDDQFGDLNLITGDDPSGAASDAVSFAAGSSGTYTAMIDLTDYAWSADESPGLTGSISNIRDFDFIQVAFAADMSAADGSGAITLDNVRLHALQTPSIMPEFSWDTIPRWIIFRSGNRISDEAVERIGDHYQVTMLEKPNQQGFDYTEDGFADVATRLKTANPNIINLAYWNSYYYWPGYRAGIEFYENYEAWSKDELDTGGRMKLEFSNTDMQEWWVRTALEIAALPGIDGLDIDTIRPDAQPMIAEMHRQLSSEVIAIGNGTWREEYWLNYFDGSYMEGWAPDADFVVDTIHYFREDNLALGKIALFRGGPEYNTDFTGEEKPSSLADRLDWVERNVDFSLAVYLMVAEEYAYFQYSENVYAGNGENDWHVWDTSYMDIFSRPLGPPLGDPVKEGYLYTRSFQYLDVSVNVETGETSFDWKTPEEAHWALDDASGGTVTDSSGNGFDGTVTNGSRVAGIDGGALEFDGSGSGVSLPAEAFSSISNQITIAMWAYGSVNQPVADSVLYAIDASSNRVLNIHLPFSNSTVYWDAGFSGTYDRIQQTASAADFKGQWNHWVFSKNAASGEMKIFLNGSPWASGDGKTRAISGITDVRLGSDFSGAEYSGLIDDVLLYRFALSDEEVAQLYQQYELVNGVPVDWLPAYGLARTDEAALEDADGDGLLNWEEYVAGLNPTNYSPFTVSDFSVGTSNSFTWSAVSGRVYNIYWSSNLVDGFTLIQSNLVNGSFSDIDASADQQGFYKISVELER
ncbi:putative glycoside hydrolase [Pontiellaceae bacterium B12219]|nr:putative glycoside hydrolase [Pontiellaceae bacterium B12219]